MPKSIMPFISAPFTSAVTLMSRLPCGVATVNCQRHGLAGHGAGDLSFALRAGDRSAHLVAVLLQHGAGGDRAFGAVNRKIPAARDGALRTQRGSKNKSNRPAILRTVLTYMPPGKSESNMSRRCRRKGRFWVIGGGSARRQQRLPGRMVGADAVLLRQRRPARRPGRRDVGRPHLPGRFAARRRTFGCGALVWIPFVACAGVGLWLAYAGATLSQQRALDAHGVLAALGALSLAMWLAALAFAPVLSERTRALGSRLRVEASRRLAGAGAALLVIAVVLPSIIKPIAARRWAAQHTIVNPLTPPVTMEGEGVGPAGPFFPSSARTNVGGIIPANFFMTSATCARCHKDIYDQWNSSAHHFSSFNNQWYRKSIEYMQDITGGTQPSKWCAGCHDHAVFFNGRFDRPIKEQIDTPEAQAGLACTSCHSIVHVGSSMGQGDFTVEYPPHARSRGQRQSGADAGARCAVVSVARASPQDVHQAVSPRTDRGVLLELPQGPPRRAGEQLPVVPRLQRLRQLAGLGRVGPGRAVVLLPAEAAALRRLPHAAGRRRTIRQPRTARSDRIGFLAPTPRCRSSTRIRFSSRRCRISCATGRSPSMCLASRAAMRPPPSKTAPVAPPNRGSSSTFAVGEESAQFGAACGRGARG